MVGTLNNGITLQQGRYRIEQLLGEGGFGITYQATDMRLGRGVAIKELFMMGCTRDDEANQSNVKPPLTFTPQAWSKAIQNFLGEARIIAGLDHPNIVTVYDQFEENNTAYMVMKFIVGTTLTKLMFERGGVLTEDEALNYTVQIGRALEVVHAHNLLHRDVKPSNIVLQPNGQAVLIDFGAAREFAADRSMAVTAIASSGFSPPEQFYAKGRKGPYTDVFALAATCYYLITGVSPTHELEQPPATRLLPALNHGLAFNPQDRPQTVAVFLDELTGAKPAPPIESISSVIQVGDEGGIPDSYLQAAYQPTPNPPPAFANPQTIISAPPPNPDQTAVAQDFVRRAEASTSVNALPPQFAAPPPPPPVYTPAAPMPQPNRLPLIIGGIAAIALLGLLAFLLLGNNQQRNSEAERKHATETAVALVASAASPSDTPIPSDTPAPSDTPYPTDTPAPTDTPYPTDTPIPTDTPAPTDTLIPSDTPLPSDTPIPSDTPTPTDTPTPKPTRTLKPPTKIPVPPSPTLAPPPNPTTSPSSALGPGWVQLGPADFTTYYCSRVQAGAAARLTKPLRQATALDWACYSTEKVKVGGVDIRTACRAKYGNDAGMGYDSEDDANSWYCHRGDNRLGPAPIQEYCAAVYLYGEAGLEDLPDVKPLYRWACFSPKQIGPIDTAATCVNQYASGALGYWLALDEPRWSCWKLQL